MNPDIISGLTWTDNEQAETGSVAHTLDAFFPGDRSSVMFGGHRPVPDTYLLHQMGRYVQINTPNRHVVAVIRSVEDFAPERDIIEL